MLTKLVNLTQLYVVKEIQEILQKSSKYKGNLILQNPIYQQQLSEYVLAKINHRYLKIENLTEIPKEAAEILPKCPIQELLEIRELLERGILNIEQEMLKQTQTKNLSSARKR